MIGTVDIKRARRRFKKWFKEGPIDHTINLICTVCMCSVLTVLLLGNYTAILDNKAHDMGLIENGSLPGLEDDYEILDDLNSNAIVTVPIEYTDKYREYQIKNGVYSPKMTETVEVKRSDIPRGNFQYIIHENKAYMTLKGQILGSVLDESHNNNPDIIAKGITEYTKRSETFKEIISIQKSVKVYEKILLLSIIIIFTSPIAIYCLNKLNSKWFWEDRERKRGSKHE